MRLSENPHTSNDSISKASKTKESIYSSFRSSISSLSQSKGMVIMDPNGKLFHAVRPGQKNESVPVISEREEFVYVDELINNDARSNQVNLQVLDNELTQFKVYMLLFKIFMIFQFAYDVFIITREFTNGHTNILDLMKFYQKLDSHPITILYYCLVAVEIIFCLIYYVIGFFACYKNSIKLLDIFTVLCLLGMIIQMILSLIDEFDLAIFIFRILSFVYAKQLMAAIIKIIVLPRFQLFIYLP